MAAGDDTSEVVALASYTPEELGQTSEVVALASFTPEELGQTSEVVALASFTPSATAITTEAITLVSYIWVQPPPWPQEGHQSPSDAYNDLPGSGDPSPWESNWDALRGLKPT